MNPSTDPNPTQESEKARILRAHAANRFALEVCFLLVVGVLVVLAFLEATTYAMVSARTPFVIMVPLLALIVIHAVRLWRASGGFEVRERVSDTLRGGSVHFNKVIGFSAWMVALVVMITVLGHYAGIFAFCVILMRFLAGESWKMTLLVALGTTAFIFGVFEVIFNIDLYRGLVVRYFMGYRDF
ncbi:tripartite tricarboxylate transporter TctB family protein [Citreimonas sp.]|uniref:tripartite tricarboxylate transporter TctB family protein n=1 Tax=Citreimonas sp. TaxID=3036715 RepID=UPI0035C83975